MASLRTNRQLHTGARASRVAAVLLLPWLASAAWAVPGETLFYDDLDWNRDEWRDSGPGEARITNDTAEQGRSMRLGEGRIEAWTRNPIDAAVPAARLEVWIRRGDEDFSEDPDEGEDLRVSYLDADGDWQVLETFPGEGGPGEIFSRSYDLPAEALHDDLGIRFDVTDGDNNADYWHIDNVRITELEAPAAPGGVVSCEDFEDGLGDWSIDAPFFGGDAGTSTATASSPVRSLFTRGGEVEVTSDPFDLAGGDQASLSLWIRRGGNFPGSDAPRSGDDLVVQYLDDGGDWVTLETFTGAGTDGQVYTPLYQLPADALHTGFRVRIRQADGSWSGWFERGDYWHVDDVCITAQSEPLSWRFEEAEWTGAGGEILETSGSGLDGTVIGGAANDDFIPALTGNPGTCGYADFDGVNDYVEIPDDPALDQAGEFTVATWINMRSYPSDLHTIVSKDTNYEFHIDAAGRVYWWWEVDSFRTNGFSVSLNQWHHIAVTFRQGLQVIYVDGVPRATNNYTGALPQNDLPLIIGADWEYVTRAFDGLIDEVYLLPEALTEAEVQSLMLETHDCPTVAAQFAINHDNFGIHCAVETVTVSVVDPVAGTPLLNYDAEVRLDTQSGQGSWTLASGGGAFSDGAAGDGVATYDWPLGESQAQFSLSYPQGPPSIDVDAWQTSDPAIRDTDAEGNLVFSPNGFTVTAAPLPNPPPVAIPPFAGAQTAAVPFALHITAYGQSPNDPACGVIESYSGSKNLAFWFHYVDPSSGTRDFEIDGAGIAAAEALAAPQVVAFASGQATVTAKYKDVGRTQVLVKDDTTLDAELPAGIRGATADFTVRPERFVLGDIRDAAGAVVNPQAADGNGPVFIAAGAPFRATVTALDAEGDPTPNYGREAVPESVSLEALLIAPAAGEIPAVNTGTGFGSFSNGSATGADFTWPEVGIIALAPHVGDGDYLLAGDVTGPVSENVGRFVPSHFTTTLNNPMFQTACTAGSYTYLGEAFGYLQPPEIRAVARAAGGAPTENYTGDFFKLSGSTIQDRNYSAAEGTLDVSGLPAAPADPAVAEVAGQPGVATLTFSSGSGMLFARGTPAAPFDADIRLAIDVIDADGVSALANPVTFGAASGIPFNAGGEMRYGRVRIANALGSERVDLPVPMLVEYFAGSATGFVVNDTDACTTDVSLAYATFTENLDLGETCVLDSGTPGASGAGCPAAAPAGLGFTEPPALGSFNLRLAAPGDGNTGSVELTGSVPAWLRFDWDATLPGDENPVGQAVFGLFPGNSKQIYTREVY